MDINILNQTAQAMVAHNKGLIAMDESNPTCNKRFADLGILQTPEMRRRYREMILTTSGLNEGINAAILYDETLRQHLSDGTPFVKAVEDAGIIPGIKVDIGAKDLAGFPNEKITEGFFFGRSVIQNHAGLLDIRGDFLCLEHIVVTAR